MDQMARAANSAVSSSSSSSLVRCVPIFAADFIRVYRWIAVFFSISFLFAVGAIQRDGGCGNEPRELGFAGERYRG